MKQIDHRVQQTQEVLYEAMVDLIIEQGYEETTVRQIAERAGIGYKTFYRHYEGKDDLLTKITNGLLLEVRKVLLPPTTLEGIEQNTAKAFHFAKKHARLMKAIFRSPVAEVVERPVVGFGLGEGYQIYQFSHQQAQKTPTIPADLVSYHFVSSVLGLLRWWIENDMPYTPEEMGDYINRLVVRPILRLPDEE